MSNRGRPRGLLFVVSAPSGTGKTTLAERLVERVPDLHLSRSYTCRPARPGEVNGVDYHFVDRARFEAMIAGREFLEWAEIVGNLYGTSFADTDRHLAAGQDLVLVIDVQGARTVRHRGIPSVHIFILPPSPPVLEERLRGRSKDPEPEIRRRLAIARQEVKAFSEYDYVVVNDDVEACLDRLRAIVLAERSRLRTAKVEVEAIVRSFDRGSPQAAGAGDVDAEPAPRPTGESGEPEVER